MRTATKVGGCALLVLVILGLAAWARRLDTRLRFDELKRRSHINAAAQAADQAADFSQRIRAGLPTPAAANSYE